MEIKFKRLEHGEGLPLPAYATAGAAAMDICSAETFTLHTGGRKVVSTGFAATVPEGYELQVRPRSGLAAKDGMTIVNSPGTVDSDYRGEIKIILQQTDSRINDLGTYLVEGYPIYRGDRIAQLVLTPVTQAVPIEVEELDETTRGAGGFGSTGRN